MAMCLPGMSCFEPTPYPDDCGCGGVTTIYYPTNCTNNQCPITVNSNCVIYNGPDLPNSEIETDDTLLEALEKIDATLEDIYVSGVPETRTLTINGVTYDLSANRSWNVGTVTSVAALTLGTTGTDLSSSVANSTTTPIITLNVPTASASNRGVLSSSDWTTFSNKVSSVTAGVGISVGGTATNPIITNTSGITGLTATRVVVSASATSITDYADLVWNSTPKTLTVFGNTISSGGDGDSLFIGSSVNTTSTGNNNICIGDQAGEDISLGIRNIGIGFQSLASITSGDENIGIGTQALALLTNGDGNIAIGVSAGNTSTNINDCVIIGTNVDTQQNGVDYQLTIQNAIFGLGNSSHDTTISSGNIGFYSSDWGANSQRVISIGNGVAPTTSISNGIQIFSTDSSDNTATLGLYLEQAVEAIGVFTASHKVKVKINGVEYYISLDAV